MKSFCIRISDNKIYLNCSSSIAIKTVHLLIMQKLIDERLSYKHHNQRVNKKNIQHSKQGLGI
jgi:p-aminobenzoyl-glutamate transporter AbgT